MSESSLAVAVCYSASARQCAEVRLQLPHGSRLVDAIRESGLLAGVPDAQVDALQTGVWGRKLPVDHVLREGDRVELYRVLKVDPKVARRERFSQQGARTTGLFSKRRAGAKSGY
ncbi:RnfH family protein [Rhodoferax lacus]|uniref:RnfH family protein n=1 Tax=Rhodoferax lacus TaxID=2184758 RepID=UPI0018F379CD|nr:RnfH family protein [Rhodoferax lacus]